MYGTLGLDPDLPRRKDNLEKRPSDARTGRSINRRQLMATAKSGSVFNEIFTQQSPTRAQQGGETRVHVSKKKPKTFVYTMLNPRSSEWQAVMFKWFITIVILFDLLMFIISTEPGISDDQRILFQVAEGITSTIFLIEVVARLVTVTESQKYGEQGPFRGRLAYSMTFPAVIDAIATLPFFLEFSTGWDLPTLTYLRSFRLLRILKSSGMVQVSDYDDPPSK
jgi:hypothetical protein